jgi:hypothetical protein
MEQIRMFGKFSIWQLRGEDLMFATTLPSVPLHTSSSLLPQHKLDLTSSFCAYPPLFCPPNYLIEVYRQNARQQGLQHHKHW